MAVNHEAVFPQTARSATVVTTAANVTLTDTPDNVVQLVTFGADGGELTHLHGLPRASIAAHVGYLYSSTDAGATKRLVRARPLGAQTVSTTAVAAENDFGWTEDAPYRGKGGEILYVGTSVALAAGIAYNAQWRDY